MHSAVATCKTSVASKKSHTHLVTTATISIAAPPTATPPTRGHAPQHRSGSSVWLRRGKERIKRFRLGPKCCRRKPRRRRDVDAPWRTNVSPRVGRVHEKRAHVRLPQIKIFGLNQEPLGRPSPVFWGGISATVSPQLIAGGGYFKKKHIK